MLGALALVPWIHLPFLALQILESGISKSQHHRHWASSFIMGTVLCCILYPPHASSSPSPNCDNQKRLQTLPHVLWGGRG